MASINLPSSCVDSTRPKGSARERPRPCPSREYSVEPGRIGHQAHSAKPLFALASIRRKDVAMWNVVEQIWQVPQGQFTFHVGSSSRQLPLVSPRRAVSVLSTWGSHSFSSSDHHAQLLSGATRVKQSECPTFRHQACHNTPNKAIINS